MNINIFAKPAFLNTASNVPFISKEASYKGHGHLQRVSSMIRGDQIADYAGFNLNPEAVGDDDICIYVKPYIKKGVVDYDFKNSHSYIDIIDGWGLLPTLEKYTDVGVIACSKQDQEKLQEILKREVVYIPQHSANYEKVKRTRTEVTTVGVIGTLDAFEWLPEGLEEELNKKGMKLIKYSKFFSRQDIIDFYQQIDIQVIWRPYRMRLSNPLKIVNASSFGIPTVAYEESVFKEVDGCYLPVDDKSQLLNRIDILRSQPIVYTEYSQNCLKKARFYHIDNVVKMYKELK